MNLKVAVLPLNMMDGQKRMEKEIADCRIRGDTPILPPESFVSEDKTNPLLEDEPIETKE